MSAQAELIGKAGEKRALLVCYEGAIQLNL